MIAKPKKNNTKGGNTMSELNKRKQMILKAVIDAHISCGEPIGSGLIARDRQIALSSATIRNELAELTEMGYLSQPHTSAGRVPSEKGYRYYVDMLLHEYGSTSREIQGLTEMLNERTSRLDRIIDDAVKLISTLTNYPAIAVRSFSGKEAVRQFNIMLLDEHSFIMVMLINESRIKSKHVITDMSLDEEAAVTIQKSLNNHLVNVMPDSMTYAQILELQSSLGIYGDLTSTLMKNIYDTLNDGEQPDMRVEGVDRFLEYPEFTSVDKLRSVLEMLSTRKGIIDMVENADSDEVNVYIGSENPADAAGDSTIVFKTITVRGRPIGAIGVVGPCRMDYSKVISTVEQLSTVISEMYESGRSLPGGAKDKHGGKPEDE